jgi:pimeloyl-ACP methyl ester carboxylesterase
LFPSEVPQASYNLTQPVLFVAFTKDFIALPMFGDATHGQYAKGKVTGKEVDGDHWAVLSHAAELNKFLVEWINGLDV